MEGTAQHFERTREVQKAHLVVKGEEDLDWLGGIAAFSDCTHLDGVVFALETVGFDQSC